MKTIDFFYFFGSVYAYLSVMRIGKLADDAGVAVRWRPFNVRTVMKENNVALRSEALKVPYMWRDIERRAAQHGLRFKGAPVWPTDPDLTHNLVGALAASEGWGEAFTVASFKAWIEERQPLGDGATLQRVLSALGKEADSVIAEARSDSIAKRFEEETEAARAFGVFGSPSFVAGGELFWGDDRLDEAMAWATGKHPLQKATA